MTHHSSAPRPGIAARLLAVFLAVTAVHLAAHAAGTELAQQLTKPLLMPLLAAWVWARGGPRLLVVALLFGWGGDVALQSGSDSVFLVGMASFSAGHVCYLMLFRRYGRLGERPAAALAGMALVYAVALGVVLVSLWDGLESDMRIPVAGYSLLLTVMALAAAGALGWRAGLGGGLFLFSDTLIGGRLADWSELPGQGVIIMATYTAAQYLLASSVLRAYEDGTAGGRDGAPPASSSATSRRGTTTR